MIQKLSCLALVLVAACSPAEGQSTEDNSDVAAARAEAPAVARAGAARIEVATIADTEAGLTLTLPGEVRGSRDATLGAAVGGFVERVLVENGDEVRQGQILIRVDTESAQARLAMTEIELRSAQRELDRSNRLGAALAQAQRDANQTRVDAAEAARRSARIARSRSIIRAPFAGVVAELEADQGEIAPPGAPLLRLVELNEVKVTISVSDRDVVALAEGMPARITTDAAAGAFEGTVSHINPAADLQTRSFLVDISVANAERRLLPGMIAQVTIEAALDGVSMVIPQDWVVTKLDGLGVFLEEDGVAKWNPVALGPVVRNQVVVTDGLSLGARVVVTGQRDLQEGDPVLVVREGTCCSEGRVSF